MNTDRSRAVTLASPTALHPAEGVTRLRFGLPAYIGIVAVAGVASLAVPATWSAPTSAWLPALLVLTAVSIVLEFVSVPLPGGGELSIATIPHVATILLVPAPFAALSIGVSVLIEEVSRQAPRSKLLFNVTGMLLTASLASLAGGLGGGIWAVETRAMPHSIVLLPLVTVALIYYAVNALLLSLVLAIAHRRRMLQVVGGATGGTALSELGATSIGALFALVWAFEPVLTILVALPGAVIARSFEHIRRLESETKAAVRSLAEIVDHRDSSTYHHSERVAAYSSALARRLELRDGQIELVEQAAAVHDLGKIGVPDRVLLKPGPLDDEERALMSEHTTIGAGVLGQFQQFSAGAAIVRHHHESWDGSGYPDGLVGEQIPIGARVVAVADAFDAMTSDRPYRGPMSHAEALRRLRDGAGRQWDPRVVAAFLEMMADEGETGWRLLPRSSDFREYDHHGGGTS